MLRKPLEDVLVMNDFYNFGELNTVFFSSFVLTNVPLIGLPKFEKDDPGIFLHFCH